MKISNQHLSTAYIIQKLELCPALLKNLYYNFFNPTLSVEFSQINIINIVNN